MSGAQFKVDLDAWRALTDRQLRALARQSIQALAEQIVETTPWDTGFLRGEWQPSLNVLPPPRPERDDAARSEETPGAVMARVGIVISGLEPGDTFFMTNNAAYARRLEFGFVGPDKLGRVYNQPGQFWVTRAVARWDVIVAEEARDLGFGL